MKRRVAVIGAGVFGCSVAAELARRGNEVVLYDKNRSVLAGTTANSTNRLHLGFHYPRDFSTAEQSRNSAKQFESKYPSAIHSGFPNFYALSPRGFTQRAKFLEFVDRLGVKAVECEPPHDLSGLGFQSSRITGFWSVDEPVIDFIILQELLEHELTDLRVSVNLDEQVREVSRTRDGRLRLRTDSGTSVFDFVVKATYGTDNIKLAAETELQKKKFQLTLNLEMDLPVSQFGLTILDGDFLTLLPRGFGTTSLVYAPGPSVMKTETAERLDSNFDSDSESLANAAEVAIRSRLGDWLPGLKDSTVVSRRIAVRTLLPGVEATDARPSKIRSLGNNIFEIWSGKIDHAVSIAREVADRIDQGV